MAGWAVGVALLVGFWLVTESTQRTVRVTVVRGGLRLSKPSLPLAEQVLMVGPFVAVLLATQWPIAGAAVAGTSVALTAMGGYQGSLALGLLPVVVLVTAVRGTRREAVVSAALVLLSWLWFILAVPGPSPARSEYFGVVIGSVLPLALVEGTRRAVSHRRVAIR